MLITGVRFKRHWDPGTTAGKLWAVSELKRLHSLALSEPVELLQSIWSDAREISGVFRCRDGLVSQWFYWIEEAVFDRENEGYE